MLRRYFLTPSEATVYLKGTGLDGSCVYLEWDDSLELWRGSTSAGTFGAPRRFDEADMTPWEKLREHMRSGLLECFRCDATWAPLQPPTAVVAQRIDVPCSNPFCKRPNDPGYKACWWCGTKGVA